MTYCCQQPARATFLEIPRRPRKWPAAPASTSSSEWPVEATRDVYDHSFRFFVDDTVPIDAEGELWVLPDLIWSGNALIAIALPVPFDIFSLHLDTKKTARGAAARPARARAVIPKALKDRILEEFPWLAPATVLQALEEELEGEHPPPDPGHAAALAPELGDDVLEATLETVVARLHALREDYAEEVGDDLVLDHQFYWRILGGAWTAKHKAVAADQATMYARNHARPWCDLFNWPCQKGFTF